MGIVIPFPRKGRRMVRPFEGVRLPESMQKGLDTIHRIKLDNRFRVEDFAQAMGITVPSADNRLLRLEARGIVQPVNKEETVWMVVT